MSARAPWRASLRQRRPRQIRRCNHPRRSRPLNANRRVVVAQAARLAGDVEPVDLVEHVGCVFEGQEAVGAAGRNQQRFAVVGAERRGDPALVGRAVAPKIDDDVVGRAPILTGARPMRLL